MPKKSKPDDVEFHEETDSPTYADDRNFYKVEKWTKDGSLVDRMLYAGNNLDKARKLFAEAIKHRPRIRADDPAAGARAGEVAGLIGGSNQQKNEPRTVGTPVRGYEFCPNQALKPGGAGGWGAA